MLKKFLFLLCLLSSSAFAAYNPSFFSDSNLDAFARLRCSEPVTVFDCQYQYSDQPLFWQTFQPVSTGSQGTETWLANESSISLAAGANTTSVARQTYRYFRYQPGKSQLVIMTGVLDSGVACAAGVVKRLGYYDAQNGIFFQMNGTTLQVGQRSYTSGAAVDTLVSQASWNIDKMNGTGPSGLTINPALSQIFIIDLQWLGMGRVRMGINVNGVNYYCHEFYWANLGSNTTVYMQTANLPLRCEVINTSGGTANYTLKQTCSTVTTEGGYSTDLGPTYAAATASAGVSVGTSITPIISLRLSHVYGGNGTSYTISAVSANGPPAVVTISTPLTAAQLAAYVGAPVTITGATGDTAINGTWVVGASSTTTSIYLTGATGSGSYNANSGSAVFSNVNRAALIPLSYAFLCGSNTALISLVFRPTLSGATFAVNPGGAGQVDLAATSMSGGTLIDCYWVSNNGGQKVALDAMTNTILQLARAYTGTAGDQDILTIAGTATTGTSTINAGITWRENY
jgi:hypothetical protein